MVTNTITGVLVEAKQRTIPQQGESQPDPEVPEKSTGSRRGIKYYVPGIPEFAEFASLMCAGHVRQSGSESLLHNLMEVKC